MIILYNVWMHLVLQVGHYNPVQCLDAFGATGMMGLQWVKHCSHAVKVTISDINEKSVELIKENSQRNGVNVKGSEQINEEMTVEVMKSDANVLLHQRAFDFIHLDPYGTSVQYLEAAFHHVSNHGIVSVTSTDVSSLFGKSDNVTLRNYGGYLMRTEYYRELGARMLLQAVARAAAKCYKGIEVLISITVEHFVLVIVRVHRGGKPADNSVNQIKRLLHCRICEDRVYIPTTTSVPESNYSILRCDCHKNTPGRIAVELGPIWGGSIFNAQFICSMKEAATKLNLSNQVQGLLDLALSEAVCSVRRKPFQIRSSVVEPVSSLDDGRNGGTDNMCGKRPQEFEAEDVPAEKKAKRDSDISNTDVFEETDYDGQPSFYFNLHKHSQKDMNTPKTAKMVQFLQESGYRASRTHFDNLAVRTNATLQQFVELLRNRGSKTLKL
ncbi:TRMT1-like protein isoform X2 [Ptychodera flava]|uniref:TRMT1-like protein isoform X2 n=1 Tax=Ptychodera flava TaxID=63121 RepID=UPI00396A8373